MFLRRLAPDQVRQTHPLIVPGRALGDVDPNPTLILTDNKANMLIANHEASAARMKFTLAQQTILTRACRDKEILVAHAKDAEMPIDFCTKWVSAIKINDSVRFCSNTTNHVEHQNSHAPPA